MSKLPIAGIVCAAGLVVFAILPQVSTAEVSTVTAAAASASHVADRFSTASVNDGAGSYRTCFMKRSVVYTDGTPKVVTARQCTE